MDRMNISYKEFHENYLSNHTGGGLLEVPLILCTVVLIGFHSIYLRCLVSYRNELSCFLLDFIAAMLPSILLITIMNDHLMAWFHVLLLSFAAIIVKEVYFRRSNVTFSKALMSKATMKRRPFITNFKSIISLLSVICILAVDFRVFPKKYIKTEAYGYSLMDTGVGFFIVANGITCNLEKENGLSRKSFIGNVPVLILGVIRYLTTEKINYQKHVTEYGVHWNFFFTLAVVKFIGPYLAANIPAKWYLLPMWFAVHEGLLKAGLEPWVMGDTPRMDLLSANREGVVSILGYLCLFVLGAHLGSWLLYARPTPSVKEDMKKAFHCIIGFAFLTAYLHFNVFFKPSRRLANPTFVIWMTSICLFVLGIAMLWESLAGVFCRRMNCGCHHGTTLFILEAISANNLAFFLVGNLLTGAVNITMDTLLVPPFLSMLVIVCYVAVCTGLISVIYSKKVNLKYW